MIIINNFIINNDNDNNNNNNNNNNKLVNATKVMRHKDTGMESETDTDKSETDTDKTNSQTDRHRHRHMHEWGRGSESPRQHSGRRAGPALACWRCPRVTGSGSKRSQNRCGLPRCLPARGAGSAKSRSWPRPGPAAPRRAAAAPASEP